MNQVKLIIEWKDGKLHTIYSNVNLMAVVINRDNPDFEEDPLSQIHIPDVIQHSLHELYDSNTPAGNKIRNNLKQYNF